MIRDNVETRVPDKRQLDLAVGNDVIFLLPIRSVGLEKCIIKANAEDILGLNSLDPECGTS